MAGEDAVVSLIQIALGGVSLYSLLTDSLKIALLLMFAMFVLGSAVSFIRNRASPA